MTNWTNASTCLCVLDATDNTTNTDLDLDFEYPVHLYPVPVLTGITVTCSLLFLVGISGNLLTILLVLKYKDMRTTTNLYLCSMALSDLLIFLCMPLDLYRVWRYRPWNLGEHLCKLFQFVSESCTYSAVLSITALSVERYVAICFPLRAKVLVTRGRVKALILLLWLVALCSAGPIFALVGVEHENGTDPHETNECKATEYAIRSGLLTVMVWISSVFFFLPVLCLTVLYSLISRTLWRRRKNPVGPVSSRDKNNTQTVKMLGKRSDYSVSFKVSSSHSHIHKLHPVYTLTHTLRHSESSRLLWFCGVNMKSSNASSPCSPHSGGGLRFRSLLAAVPLGPLSLLQII